MGKFYRVGEHGEQAAAEISARVAAEYKKKYKADDHCVMSTAGSKPGEYHITLHYYSWEQLDDSDSFPAYKFAEKHKHVSDLSVGDYHKPDIDMASRTVLPASVTLTIQTT